MREQHQPTTGFADYTKGGLPDALKKGDAPEDSQPPPQPSPACPLCRSGMEVAVKGRALSVVLQLLGALVAFSVLGALHWVLGLVAGVVLLMSAVVAMFCGGREMWRCTSCGATHPKG